MQPSPTYSPWMPSPSDLDFAAELAPIAILHAVIHQVAIAIRAAHPDLYATTDLPSRHLELAAARASLSAALALQESLLAYRDSMHQAHLMATKQCDGCGHGYY